MSKLTTLERLNCGNWRLWITFDQILLKKSLDTSARLKLRRHRHCADGLQRIVAYEMIFGHEDDNSSAPRVRRMICFKINSTHALKLICRTGKNRVLYNLWLLPPLITTLWRYTMFMLLLLLLLLEIHTSSETK